MSKIELTEQELQQKINSAIDDAVSGLKRKNKELLTKLSKYKEVDPNEYVELKDKIKSLEEQTMSEQEKQEKLITQQRETIDNLNKELKDKQNILDNLNQENVVNTAITSLGIPVKEGMGDALSIYLKSQLIQDGDKYYIKDKDPVEFIKEWVKEDGKHFFRVNNIGGSATGAGKESIGRYKDIFDKSSDKYNLTEQIKLKRTDPSLYNQLIEKYSK